MLGTSGFPSYCNYLDTYNDTISRKPMLDKTKFQPLPFIYDINVKPNLWASLIRFQGAKFEKDKRENG